MTLTSCASIRLARRAMRIVRQNVALSPDGSAVTATCSASMSSLDAMVNEIDHESGRPPGCEAAELDAVDRRTGQF